MFVCFYFPARQSSKHRLPQASHCCRHLQCHLQCPCWPNKTSTSPHPPPALPCTGGSFRGFYLRTSTKNGPSGGGRRIAARNAKGRGTARALPTDAPNIIIGQLSGTRCGTVARLDGCDRKQKAILIPNRCSEAASGRDRVPCEKTFPTEWGKV